MDSFNVQDIVRQLNDAELAAVVCLVAEQHCIIRAEHDQLDKLQAELQLMCSTTFGFSCASLDCSPDTTIAEFREAVVRRLDSDSTTTEDGVKTPAVDIEFSYQSRNVLDSRKVANVVIAKNLDQASHTLQLQALELMRSRRIYSKQAAHAVPKHFLFIALLSSGTPGPPLLTPYLNDHFFISHIHSSSSSSIYVDSNLASETSSINSQSSVIRKRKSDLRSASTNEPFVNSALLSYLQAELASVRLSAELRRYIHNIVTFMRLHRAVAGGVSAISSRHLTLLSRILAPLHGLNYVSPSLVALAVRKVYPHRIEITTPENERSMQWGSDVDAVAEILEGVTPEVVIEEILGTVEAPL